jgi:hypothetical protein
MGKVALAEMPTAALGASKKVGKVALPVEFEELKNVRNEAVLHLPGFCQSAVKRLLKDERDLELFENLLFIAVLAPATAALVFLAPFTWLKVLIGVLRIPVLFLVFGGRFILGLHYWSHAPKGVFRKEVPLGSLIQAIPAWFVAPFFGIPAGFYYIHHIVMHHHDNNVSASVTSESLRSFPNPFERRCFRTTCPQPCHTSATHG